MFPAVKHPEDIIPCSTKADPHYTLYSLDSYVHSHTHYFYNHTVGKSHFAVQTEFDLDGLTPTALVPVHAKLYPSEVWYNLKFGVFTYNCLSLLASNDLQSLFALHSHAAHAYHIRLRTNNACYSACDFPTWLFH